MDLASLQPRLFERFQRIVQSERLSHAYLFSGDFGSFELAKFLAKSRFCQNLQEKLPCSSCRSCRLIEQEEFSDVKIIQPVNQVIKTDTIRQLLQEFSKSGYESASQVFIIKDAEKMHVNAANSLLKLMEEPTAQSYLILLTSDVEQVLPTIKSRCQVFHFPRNLPLLQELLEKEGLLKEQAKLVAQLASSPQEAFGLAKDNKFFDLVRASRKWLELLFKDSYQAYLELNRLVLLAKYKDEQDMVWDLLQILMTDFMDKPTFSLYLEHLSLAREMWRSNVSFQNALEYMVLQ